MAFLPPEEQNNQAPQGPTSVGSAPPPSSGGSSGAGAAPKAGSAPSSGTPTQFGSSSSKLGDYLSANAPQITDQANNISQGLNTQFGQVGNDITNAANQFGQQVQSGYTAGNQDLVNQAASNPTGFVSSDPNNISAFQAQYNDQYTGPQNFESTTPYSNIQNEVNNAVQGAQSLGTQGGLQNYFASTGKNPTQASNTLDALLINGNPQAQQQVQQAASQFNGLTDQFGNAVKGANAQVQTAQQAADAAKQYAQGQIGKTVDQFGNTLNTQLQGANQSRDAYNSALSDLQAKATPLVAPINSLMQTAPNLGLTNYFSNVPGMSPVINPATLGTTASADQYGEDAALEQLLGNNYNQQLTGDSSQAGTFKTPGAAPNFNDLLTQQIQNLGHQYKANVPDGSRVSKEQQQAYETLAKYLSQAEGDEDQYGWSNKYQDTYRGS